MILKPLKDSLVLRALPRPTETPGGIFTGHLASDELTCQFKVLAIGPRQRECRVGDIVIANTYCGTEVQIDGAPARLAAASSILAIIERKE